jgi:hypothetical protein
MISNVKYYFLESLYKSFIATIFFIVVYQFSNIEIIRSNIEDISFDLLNKFAIEDRQQNTNSPNILLFKFDDFYLKEKKIVDDRGNTNYGYLFPRDNIANFIEKLDNFVKELEINNRPLSLFIDYDFSYTSLPYSKELSEEDIAFLNILKKDRDYKIYLPKTNDINFIEQSKDKKIQELIKSKKINFVSVGLIESSDDIARRYLPYREFFNAIEKQSYLQAMIALWRDSKNNQLDDKEIYNKFTDKSDIENRIIFKNYEERIDEGDYETYLSNWKKLFVYSVNYPFDEIIEDNFYNSIILLGGTHSNNDDIFNIQGIKGVDSLSGIEIQANTLMTLFYLDGKLEKFDFIKSVVLVFLLFFIVNFIIEILFDILGFQDRRNLEFIVLLVVISGTMFFISYYILTEYKQWFNWFIPVVLFEAVEIIEMIKKYSIESFEKIKEKKNEKITNVT